MGWQTDDSGGEFDGKIIDATFGFDDRFGDNLILILDITRDDMDEPYTMLLTCGKGWDTPDGGKTAEHPKSKNFNTRSSLGRVIDAIAKIKGAVDRIDGEPTEAASWVGQHYLWATENYTTTFGGEAKERYRWLPAALVGAAPKKSTAKAANGTPEGLTRADLAKLRKLHKDAISHDAFVDAAYAEVDAVAADSEVEAFVLDEANWG